MFVLPELSHPMHFFGDEDFHLPVLMHHKDSLSRYFTTGEPYPISQSLQYPSLVYGIGSLFSYSNTVAGLRAHLSFWYFLGIIIVSLSLTTLPKNLRHNIANLGFIVSLSFSGLLLTYTVDFYLDIALFPLMTASGIYAIFAVQKKRNEYAASACMMAGLAGIARQSSFPFIITVGVSMAIWIHLSDIKNNKPGTRLQMKCLLKSIFCLLVAIGPLALWMLLGKYTESTWVNHLSLHNILLFDYGLFFKYAFVFFGPVLILSPALFYLKRMKKKDKLYILLALAVSLVGEILLWAMALPYWEPWSRYYLMFYGILVVMAVSSLQKNDLSGKTFVPIVILISMIFNIFISFQYLKQDTLFHENETIYEYSNVFKYFKNNKHQQNKNIYIHTFGNYRRGSPIFNWQYHDAGMSAYNLNPKWIDVSPNMDWQIFKKRLPLNAEFVIFHWAKSLSASPVVARIHTFSKKPSPHDFSDYEVLLQYDDPRSEGRKGYVFLKKKNK